MYNENDKVWAFDLDGEKKYGTLHKNTEHPDVSEWFIRYEDGEECAVLDLSYVFPIESPTSTDTGQQPKTMFEKLDYLNKLDIESGSKNVQVTGPQNIISVDKKGNHGEVKIGVSPDIPVDIFKGKDLRLMLIIVDGEQYDKIKD